MLLSLSLVLFANTSARSIPELIKTQPGMHSEASVSYHYACYIFFLSRSCCNVGGGSTIIDVDCQLGSYSFTIVLFSSRRRCVEIS